MLRGAVKLLNGPAEMRFHSVTQTLGAEAVEAARRTYAYSVKVAKDMMSGLVLGQAIGARRAQRAVLRVVDQVLQDRASMLGMLTLPGVQSPAEIQLAIRSGADVLKFFPADPPGPTWLAQVAPAYSQKPFMATGGVTVDNMAAFFDAGAIAVGMGDTLFGRYDDPDAAVDRIAAAVAIARNR